MVVVYAAHRFAAAIELYSQAIILNTNNAVYWANRAFAHTKMEEYGSAVEDATKAITISPTYVKVAHMENVPFPHGTCCGHLCIVAEWLPRWSERRWCLN
jgi:tetratricopeptide (TPR) repeat protein